MIFLISCQTSAPRNTSANREAVKQKNMRTPLAGPIKYVALGDSTGVGVGARNGGYVARLFKRIEKSRPDSTLTNLCVSGATSEDVRRSQLDQAIKANPNFVTLGIGINDIGHGFSAQDFGENIDAVLARLSSDTEARLIVSNIPDISSAPRLPQLMRDEVKRLIVLFNQQISEIAERYGATVVDIHQATQAQLQSHPEYFSADGFHPSDLGYETWAQQMWPKVAEVVGVEEK